MVNSSNPSVQSKMALAAASFLCDSDARTQVSIHFTKSAIFLSNSVLYASLRQFCCDVHILVSSRRRPGSPCQISLFKRERSSSHCIMGHGCLWEWLGDRNWALQSWVGIDYFLISTLWRHSVEYYVKTPYLVSYWLDTTISHLAVSQQEVTNFFK
jgi:hypothetical protein